MIIDRWSNNYCIHTRTSENFVAAQAQGWMCQQYPPGADGLEEELIVCRTGPWCQRRMTAVKTDVLTSEKRKPVTHAEPEEQMSSCIPLYLNPPQGSTLSGESRPSPLVCGRLQNDSYASL